jgi:hypothetical protein
LLRQDRHDTAGILLWFLDVDQHLSQEQFEALLPLAVEWAAEQEQRILREGMPLSEHEIADAKAVGVRDPERVRLLQVEAIPAPAHPKLKAAYDTINFLPVKPRGLTLRYGIFVRADCRQDRHLLLHELVHTAQYERLGGIVAFLRKYLFECATAGYRAAPLEEEATAVARRVQSP